MTDLILPPQVINVPLNAVMMLGPGLLESPVAAGDQYDVANSVGEGIFSFGGFAFPVLSSCSQPDLTIQIRDDNGDRETLRQTTQCTGTRVVNVTRIDGTNFDQGGAGYDTDGSPTALTAFCSHGRWITAAGVSRTVQRTTQIIVKESFSPFATIETWTYDLTAVFSG